MRRNAQEDGELWLAQAVANLRWADHLAEEGDWHLACSLAQQVTKEVFKAFLYAQGEGIVLGYSVERRCAVATRYRPGFADKARRWGLHDGYCAPTRWPNGLPDGDPANVYPQSAARDAVALAEDP